jgi:hypothetical protein
MLLFAAAMPSAREDRAVVGGERGVTILRPGVTSGKPSPNAFMMVLRLFCTSVSFTGLRRLCTIVQSARSQQWFDHPGRAFLKALVQPSAFPFFKLNRLAALKIVAEHEVHLLRK